MIADCAWCKCDLIESQYVKMGKTNKAGEEIMAVLGFENETVVEPN